jgi:hypothetical protein
VTIGPDGKPVFGGGVKGTFGGPEKAPAVRCFKCHCPPPLPEYSCRRDRRKHEKKVVKEKAKDAQIKLLYAYNSTKPQDPEAFEASAESVGSLAQAGYQVQRIWGYASPEGSLDAPKPPVPGFKGNLALSQARADHARATIAARAPAAALPAAEGKGEQLGDLEGSGDTADKDLTAQLVALLQPLDDDQRLEALGVAGPVRQDPEQRRQALADIEAFVQGRDAKGLKLGTRPRWEKVFPFLRRVDVALHKPELSEMQPVPAKSTTGCDADDIAYAKAKMPALPPERKLPPEACDR